MTAFQIGRPRFVSGDEALAFHMIAIEEYGGAHGIRDAGSLDSALAMAKQGFSGEFAHEFPFEMAAAYAFHIAKNHPFVDGNKRTALACCAAFLRMNGWNLVSGGTAAADAIIALVEGKLDKHGLGDWLKQNCKARPSIELRDFFAQLTYSQLSEFFKAGLAGQDPGRSKEGRITTILEATESIPAVGEANRAVRAAQDAGEHQIAATLHAQSSLLTAIYRIAEDMGYEW